MTRRRVFGLGAALLLACAGAGPSGSTPPQGRSVLPGISVLLADSIQLVKGKRVGLLTNQTGIDERGRSDIDLLHDDPRAKSAGVQLVSLFSPEHGIRGTEDRANIENSIDAQSGLPIYSLYGATTLPPPDSLMRQIDVMVFDLQDIGTRTWTYVANLIFTMRAAKRNNVAMVVLDRPNPLGGEHRDGPMLDSALANPFEQTAARPARPYALYPFPLRHGMTMGELALFYNTELGIYANLHVVPMRGWRRSMWFDETGLPWVKPSPNLPSLASATIYPALVPFEGSNLSVGRGTDIAFQWFGAPWLNADATARLLNEREVPGVRFVADRFTPRAPSDGKFADRTIPGVRIELKDRDRLHAGRLSAAILWAVERTSRDSLRLQDLTFDLRLGEPRAREALLRDEDPDTVIDQSLPAVIKFEQRAKSYLLYR